MPSLLDGVKIKFHETLMEVRHVANVSPEGPRTLVVAPFDRKYISYIEKAILESNIGLTPQNDGYKIRLNLPIMTKEKREEISKQVRQHGEEAKIAVRNIRRDLNKKIKNEEIPEDETKKRLKQTQKNVDNYIKTIEDIIKSKEQEVMKI